MGRPEVGNDGGVFGIGGTTGLRMMADSSLQDDRLASTSSALTT